PGTPALLERVEVLRPGREKHCHSRFGDRTAFAHATGECRTREPVAQQCRGLANGSDRGGKPSGQVDHRLLRGARTGESLDGGLGAITTPLGVEGAFLVDALVGMRTKEVPL